MECQPWVPNCFLVSAIIDLIYGPAIGLPWPHFVCACSSPSGGQLYGAFCVFHAGQSVAAQYTVASVIICFACFVCNLPTNPSPLAPIKAGPDRLDTRQQSEAITGVRAHNLTANALPACGRDLVGSLLFHFFCGTAVSCTCILQTTAFSCYGFHFIYMHALCVSSM